MMQIFHLLGAALLPVCGWLAGAAFQAGAEWHIEQLQQTVELLQQIRQEVAYRRPDLDQLVRCLVQQKLLDTTSAQKLQELAAPESFTKAEKLCFVQCFSGIGRSEAAGECERLSYYLAQFEGFLRRAKKEAADRAGLPYRLGLAAGAVLALALL